MRILVISSTPWDNSNSFGNTFSNLFENMEGVEMYNLCLKHGLSNNTIVKEACQLTDKTVLRSIYKIKYDPARIVLNENEDMGFQADVSLSARKAKKTISFIIRDWIWKLGKWKKSKTLNEFIQRIKPDVLYLPIYSSSHICQVQKYFIDKLGVKVVGHISDDVYIETNKKTAFGKLYNKSVKKNVKTIIEKCEYLEVFAENMKEEYEKIFNKPCYLIGKGVKPETVNEIRYNIKKEGLNFTYTGNLGLERYKLLSELGRLLDKNYPSSKLFIYSGTPLTEEMETSFSKCRSIRFMGAVNSIEVIKVQKAADILVHVESFSRQEMAATRMSFSTKIIDYMLNGKLMFAIGPNEINSIDVLKKYGLAVVVDQENELEETLKKLFSNEVDVNLIADNVYKYLKNDRNINNIQKGIKQRFDKVVEQK